MKRKLAEIMVDDKDGFLIQIMPGNDIRVIEAAMEGLYKKVIEYHIRSIIEQQNKAIIIDPSTGQKAINMKVEGKENGKKINKSESIHKKEWHKS